MGETQNPTEIENRVVRVIADIFYGVNADWITPELLLDDDLGASGIDRIEIALALEQELEIELGSDVDENDWTTVGDVIRCVQEALA